MKRHGKLMDQITTYDNISLAFTKAVKGKTHRSGIIRFIVDRETCVNNILESLRNKTFQTSPYFMKTIYEPKERLIYILPFYPDRIVQHAIMNVMIPIWDNLFIYDSYCCRKNKGLHLASRRLMDVLPSNEYVLKCDISKFYPNINHNILMNIIERKIKDPDLLDLLANIVYSIPGETNIPIGNYTSQWFGNLYLNELDMFLKHECKVKHYFRYCDDFVLLSNDKGFLREMSYIIEEFLATRLKLKMSKNNLFKSKQGIDFLGYRHFPQGYVLLRKRTATKLKSKIKTIIPRLQAGEITKDYALSCIASYLGWLDHANSYNLKMATEMIDIFDDIKYNY